MGDRKRVHTGAAFLMRSVAFLASLADVVASTKAAYSSDEPDDSSVTEGGVHCFFVHGCGMTTTKAATATDDNGYWGGDAIIKATPQCDKRSFFWHDTTHYALDDPVLEDAVCAFLTETEDGPPPPASTSGDSNRAAAAAASAPAAVVERKVIFTHSMGNLMLAAAIRDGRCALGATASWFSAGAPWTGSQAATAMDDICEGEDAGAVPLLRDLAAKRNYCETVGPGRQGGPVPCMMQCSLLDSCGALCSAPHTPPVPSSAWCASGRRLLTTARGARVCSLCAWCGVHGLQGSKRPNAAYRSLDPSSPSLQGLTEIAQEGLSGAMCGTDAAGLHVGYALELDAVAE